MKTWYSKLRKSMGFTAKLTKNLGCGVEFSRCNYRKDDPIFFTCQWDRNTDHAGVRFELSVFGFEVNAEIRDSRHWNGREHRYYYLMEEGRLIKQSDKLRQELYDRIDCLTLDEARALLKSDLRRTSISAVIDRYEEVFDTEVESI